MSHYLSIPLRFIDPPDEDPDLALDPPALGYVIEPTGATGGKLQNRFLLRPDLDLRRFSVSARIDWIRPGSTTGRRTNWKTVHDIVKRHIGRSPRVTGPEGEALHNGDSSLVQDPKLSTL